jgi:hypothetical protein
MKTLIIYCDDFENRPTKEVEDYDDDKSLNARIAELDAEISEYSYYRCYRVLDSHEDDTDNGNNINQVAMGCKPDPTNFKIVRLEHVENSTIIIANYGGETFNGDKLMVLRGIFNEEDITTLDPHFLNEEYPVYARFIPTDLGYALAKVVARELSEHE